jgi:hypothetical protein
MTRDTLVAVLQKHPFVGEFQPQHIEKLSALAKEVRFERDHVIFHEGDECHDFYLVVEGRVALEIEAPGTPFACRRCTRATSWSAILMGGAHLARALHPSGPGVYVALLDACRADPAFARADVLMLVVPSGAARGRRCWICIGLWPSARTGWSLHPVVFAASDWRPDRVAPAAPVSGRCQAQRRWPCRSTGDERSRPGFAADEQDFQVRGDEIAARFRQQTRRCACLRPRRAISIDRLGRRDIRIVSQFADEDYVVWLSAEGLTVDDGTRWR